MNPPCPKCGHADASFLYIEGGNSRFSARADRLHLTCKRCGFSWSEVPLDRRKENGNDASDRVKAKANPP